MTHALPYLYFGPRHALGLQGGFASPAPAALVPVFSFPAGTSHMRPHISGCLQYRNFHLLSIGCAFRPRLRPRLTQGRSASPWKPWIFGRKDSHLPLATHSGILSSRSSTAPYGTASLDRQCSPTNTVCPAHTRRILPLDSSSAVRRTDDIPRLRRRVSAPDIFGAGPLG